MSCGKHVDSNEDLKAGYKFQKDSVFYRKVETWFHQDSIKFTLEDFTIVDTLHEFERYIIVDTCGGRGIPIPVPGTNSGKAVINSSITFNYGAANFNGEIVIFPRFGEWMDLGHGYFGVRKYRNSMEWGVLHIRGEMITDIKYHSFVKDTSNQLICEYSYNNTLMYDTLDFSSNMIRMPRE